MRNPVLAMIGLVSLAALSAPSVEAQSISCGEGYTVARGDTLQGLTNRAYGPGRSYVDLYKVNIDVIGDDPGLIEVGTVLNIPCDNAEVPAAAAATAPTTAATPVAVSTPAMPSRRYLRMLTGTDWAPFTNHEEARGGMITELSSEALSRVLPEDAFQIDYVKDWSSHLEPLLSDVAYDFSIPWFKPDCSKIDKLGEASRFRCQSLVFSDAIFEMLTGYFTLKGRAEAIKTHSDLRGKRICRVETYATYMLEEFDLVEPDITLVRPVRLNECFTALLEGQADVVLMSTTVANDVMGQLGIRDQVEEIPEIAYVTTMHAVTSINNPRAEEQIEFINKGLRELRDDGSWFEIVQRHLLEHARRTAVN